LKSDRFLYAFEKYGDPRFGRACTDVNTGELAKGSLFEHYPEKEIKAALADPASEIVRKSRLIDGYGVGILDSGNDQNRRAVMLNFTNLLGHRQCDNLFLQLWARGVKLLPDLGYPMGWDHRFTWDSNSLAHNTVTVDETQPSLSSGGGHSKLFGSRDGVHVVSAAHDPYPGSDTDLYQRTVVMVDTDDDRYYVVDHFAANGGEQYDQSWHGMLVPIKAPPLNWQKQPGTLAGPDVKQFGKWKDKWGRDRKDFPAYLKDIRTVTLDKPAAWTWESGLKEADAGVGQRRDHDLHRLGENDAHPAGGHGKAERVGGLLGPQD